MLTLLIISTLALAFNIQPVKAEPATVSGDITTDTTWFFSESPYIVTGDVTLFPGCTLTIEPGVTILFYPNTQLRIRGTLNAGGTESQRITFACSNGMWYGVSIATELGGKAAIRFANFYNASTAIYISLSNPGYPVVEIHDSVFANNSVGLGGYVGSGGTIVERCTFENNTYGITQADYNVYNSVFKKNSYGLYATERVNVYYCIFIENQVALYGGRGEVKYCQIINNGIGVQSFFEGFTLSNNTIANNDVGVILGQYDTYSAPVKYNDICNNVAYNLKNTGDSNKFAKYNWWGTIDPYEIEIKICDGYDDASVGVVEYSPILTGPQNMAPSTIEVERAITTGLGGIFKDTTWTFSESPYVISEKLTLFPGYTLVIEPGVEVRFSSGAKLTIRGSLVAEGTESNRITFTSTEPGTKGSWDGIDVATHLGAKASIRFAYFSYAQTAIYVHLGGSGPVNIYDSVFTDNIIALGGYGGYGWQMTVERSIFERNTYAVTSADKRILNSIFKNNDYGLYATERISVYSSILTENQVALYGGRGEVENCEISKNNIGVQSFFEGFTLSQNTIKYNDVGVILGRYDTSSSPVYLNNFINNAIQVQNPAYTTFNSPEKITYTYYGNTYTNYLGNYWSDYSGSDVDGDGIGDTPYIIDSKKDNYPLMKPFENYLAPPPPTKFKEGDIVRVTTLTLNVRNDENEIIGTVHMGYGGMVQGPSKTIEIDGIEYTFWKIDWRWKIVPGNCWEPLSGEEKISGWSAEGIPGEDWLLAMDDNVGWLARVIMSEASVGTPTEQKAVGWTVLNRLDKGKFFSPKTVGEVIFPKKGSPQFAYGKHPKPYADYIALAKKLLKSYEAVKQGEVPMIPDPTEGADHFFSPISMPKEGDDTTGFDVGGGLHQVPYDGQDKKVWFPSWARPEEGTEITEETTKYLTAEKIPRKLEWRNLADIRHWYFMFYRPYTTKIEARAGCPIELRVYDSEGRVTGLLNGNIKTEIPRTDYSDNTVTIYFPFDFYRYEVVGTDEGLYGLTVTAITTDGNITFASVDIPTSANTTHQYSINWEALVLGEEGVMVKVDSDGDGVFEHTFTSDGELTHDEFILQTETTVDFDPDTLNLRSKGAWVTAYIEFPEGYDVAGINISTILLNGTIPVDVDAPVTIGDYDNDAIPDLMVKFDRAEVIAYIIANVNMTELYEKRFMTTTLTVTGYLNNGTPFQASTTIKIVYAIKYGRITQIL